MTTNLIPVADVQTMAVAIAKSQLFGMKTPEQALALMLVAQSEGLHPARAALEYHIIQGRPALKADAMLARFQQHGGKVIWKDYTDEKVSGLFSHPSGGEVLIDWTIDRAKQAGVYGKNPTWKSYPRAMLRSRCISEGVRTVFPGVSVGVYTVEEVQDFDGPEKAKDVTPEPQPTAMPPKVKAAAAKVAGKPHKADLNVIEGSATTISGDPSESDLTGVGGDPLADELTKGKVIHAFATIGFSLDQLEKEYGKPSDQWRLDSDIPELRQVFNSMRIEQAQIKAKAAEQVAEGDQSGEI